MPSHDHAARRRATRAQRQRGCSIYIPASDLVRAGIDPKAPPPWYRTAGFQRSRNGRSVMVSLYLDGP
jgi:hypothetical protein